jgi:hypothetical protein
MNDARAFFGERKQQHPAGAAVEAMHRPHVFAQLIADQHHDDLALAHHGAAVHGNPCGLVYGHQ